MASASSQHPDQTVVHVPNDPAAVEAVGASLMESMRRQGYVKASLFAVHLCYHEAVTNAFRHGHQSLPAATPVKVSYHVTPSHVTLEIEDQGPGFDPGAIPDPTAEENLERGSGRGLLLMRAYMSKTEYNSRGNRLTMVYDRPPGAPATGGA